MMKYFVQKRHCIFVVGTNSRNMNLIKNIKYKMTIIIMDIFTKRRCIKQDFVFNIISIKNDNNIRITISFFYNNNSM